MAVSLGQMNQIQILDVKKHIQIVDAYIATGLEIDDITIHYGIDQETIANVLHSYGFGLGPSYGDPSDSKKVFHRLPFCYVEQFVRDNFPGFLLGSPKEALTLEKELNQWLPDWKTRAHQPQPSLFGLSQQEMEGTEYYAPAPKKTRGKNIFQKIKVFHKK